MTINDDNDYNRMYQNSAFQKNKNIKSKYCTGNCIPIAIIKKKIRILINMQIKKHRRFCAYFIIVIIISARLQNFFSHIIIHPFSINIEKL